MPLFDPGRRNAKAEPLHSFGLPADVLATRLDQHAQKIAIADSQISTRPDPSTRLWQEEMQQRRLRQHSKQVAEPARVSAPEGSLVDHRLEEELVDLVSQRRSHGRKKLAQEARTAQDEAVALTRRCAQILPTMSAATRPGAADDVAERWAERRASSSRVSLQRGEADGARRRLRLRVQAAKPAVDTGMDVVTDSLMLLLHAVPRRGGGGGSAVRVLRRRPTLQVLSWRRRQRQSTQERRREQDAQCASEQATRAAALAAATPAVDARLSSAIQRRRDENEEFALVRRRGGRIHAVERRAVDPEGRSPFARTHSAVVAQMAYHRHAVRSAKPSVDCKDANRAKLQGTRPRWRPALAPEGRLPNGRCFWPTESGVFLALQAHRKRLRSIQRRKTASTQQAKRRDGDKGRNLEAGGAAPRAAWRGNRVGGPGHEALPPDPAGNVNRLHNKRVEMARKRGGKLSHGWSGTGGDAWMAGRNLEKQRRQRAEARLKKEREEKVEREKRRAAERRTRCPPPRDVAVDAFYWSQLSD